MNRTDTRRDHGWTLIELLVVLSLIMILASVALVQYRNSVITAKEASLRGDLFIVTARYLRAIPKDPITNTADAWEIIEAEAEPGSTATTAGVYNVKSSSQDTALDGSRYNDW